MGTEGAHTAMLTAKMHELLLFLDARGREGGVSPSFEEMKDALGLKSKSGVHRLVEALEERGFIRRLPNRARALEVVRGPGPRTPPAEAGADAAGGQGDDNVIRAEFTQRRAPIASRGVELALVGRIAAGQPIEAIEDAEPLVVPQTLLGPGEHYALEVVGDSMQDAGILDGDYALIRRCETARDGDIVVALIDGHEATLKYLRREGGMIRLDPANARHQPQRYLPSRVRVQGKLAGLLRRY
jgi:repressor LexA